MKPAGVLLILVLALSQVSVAYAEYPRHVDPAQYELVEPDPDMLFLMYHELYLGMIFENMTIQEEWLQWAMELYSMEDLTRMFELYGDQLTFEADNLNLTRFYLDEMIKYAGAFNLPAARSSFFKGLVHLEQCNATIPLLRGTTGDIGQRLLSDPAILNQDITDLQAVIDELTSQYQLIFDYFNAGEISPGDLEKLKDAFKEVLDEELLKELEDYLDNIGGSVDLGSLIQPQLSLDLNESSTWVGSSLGVTGRLTARGAGLGGKVISVSLGGQTVTVATDMSGFYSADLRVPYLYEKSVEVRAFYWPRGDDSKIYSPATASETLLLLFIVPELKLSYSGSVLPGRDWSLSGVLSDDGEGLSGFRLSMDSFNIQYSTLSDVLGEFSFDVVTPVDVPLGSVFIDVSSEPQGVYCGVMERLVVDVVQLPLTMEADIPEWVLSGFLGKVRVSLTAGGLSVDGCELRLVGEGDSRVAYSVDGAGSVGVVVPLFRLSGDYEWRLVADPTEPWISGASLSDSFYVVNTVAVLFSAACVAVLAYYVRRYFGSRKGRVVEIVEPVVAPVVVPVVEPVVANSFSGLFRVALRIVERLSGVVMAPSDTLHEYLTRVLSRFSGRFAELFNELVARYELWLYGRPHEVELGEVEVLVAELEEDHDEG
jgi:hypothetical protein